MTWFLAWVPYALEHGHNVFFTNFIDYPHGTNLADNTLSPLLGFIGAPITLTLGPVAAFNLLLRIAFASSAASMFLVLRAWCRWPMAFIGGLMYGFGPYMATQGHVHLNLVFVPIPPLIVWCLYELLVTKARSPRRIGLLLGTLVGAQALIEPELLTMMGVVVVVGLLGIAIIKRHELRQRFDFLARALAPAIAMFALIAGYMFWMIVFGPQHIVAPVGVETVIRSFRADLLGPLVPTSQSLSTTAIAGDSARFSTTPIESTSYLGLPMALLIGVFATRWRQLTIMFLSALFALIAFVFSMGPQLIINGRSTNLPMPEEILSHLPFGDDFVPIRFSYVVILFASIAFAVGADHLFRVVRAHNSRRVSSRLQWAGAVVAIVLAVIVIIPEVPFTSQTPPWPQIKESTLSVIPNGAVVLTYPMATSSAPAAMSWAANDGLRFRLINAYAIVRQSNATTQGFPSLIHPSIIEEYLGAAQGNSFYPPPSASANPARSFCKFLTLQHIGGIIFWDEGSNPNEVKTLFLHALGAPDKRSGNGKVLVWRTASRHCAN